ncbi:ABC transporter permease [[Clostridium] sordellii]|uniref:ABC transporter permease n=1 Tax=Paraclostridium sordellii TaxID=1505 RepID=A0A0C7R244_PARSO|nr:ABC transporter permease subunit [Paeniclostridium sordellii]MCH1966022.1 ABC transporter permease subunit [Paeniclostridium sordellii]CEN78162.1 ABC transporter permease [[Clostridium] sordellii] [Paeniclostridium sordellii]CEN81038.1 ABC transporter permease [[Clostridium] sordellii] [Paeniclostridium sordellii]CEO07810.1 ABC transporter permease [[Clostridium] sordellii] [Paeniclostridium sordellii]CEP87001.1 ABC transporter permease [[Clostridium] sordellii] [Paeniclostridium sordellii]
MSEKLKKLIVNIILLTLILPLGILFIWAITSSWVYPNLIPNEFSLRGFEYILNEENIKVLLNSIFISIVVVIITLIISIPAAKAIALYEFKGKKFFELLILSPIIIPMISVAMGIQLIFIKFGIANTLTGVILINIIPCIPYGVRIIADVYKLIGDKYEIQASMLGAKKIDILRYVTIPLILPGIIGASSMCFIISFSQYFLTLLIGGGSVITYPLLMFPYIQSGDRILASMYSIVFIIISLIVVMLMKKSLEKYYNKENQDGIC